MNSDQAEATLSSNEAPEIKKEGPQISDEIKESFS